MYWHLRRLCTWVHSDVILTLFWRSGWAPTARILSTTWRWPQNEPHVKAEKSFCSGNYQTEEVGLQHLNVYECNVVYKEIKQCKMLRQILYTLNLRALPIALIMGLLFTSDLEGIRWCSKFIKEFSASNSTFITPKVERIVMNEWMKSHKSACVSPAFLSQSEKIYWSLIPQLETVIEVPTVQAQRSRANPWRLHVAIHLPSTNRTYGDIGF